MVLVPDNKVNTVRILFGNLNDIILKIVEIIMWVTPYGVFGLIEGVVVDFAGDNDIFYALGKYFITTIIGLLIMLFVLYPVYLKIFTRGVSIPKFFRAMIPAQLVGLSTSSSAAALPVTMKQVTGELGVSEEIANFVLPVGVTVNMDGASFYQSVAAVFIAQVYGIELTIMQQVTIVLTATLTSIGSPGVPGGIIVLMILVLSSVGLPAEGLALVIGLDRPIDMLRSVVNLTGDATVSCIVAYSEGELRDPSI
jgi:Na+/H+-dicarboxylate symporter